MLLQISSPISIKKLNGIKISLFEAILLRSSNLELILRNKILKG